MKKAILILSAAVCMTWADSGLMKYIEMIDSEILNGGAAYSAQTNETNQTTAQSKQIAKHTEVKTSEIKKENKTKTDTNKNDNAKKDTNISIKVEAKALPKPKTAPKSNGVEKKVLSPNETAEDDNMNFPELVKAEEEIKTYKKYVYVTIKGDKTAQKEAKKAIDKLTSKKTTSTNTKAKTIAKSKKPSSVTKQASNTEPMKYNPTTLVRLKMVLLGDTNVAVIDDQFLKVGDIVKHCKIMNINLSGIVLKCKDGIHTRKVGEQW